MKTGVKGPPRQFRPSRPTHGSSSAECFLCCCCCCYCCYSAFLLAPMLLLPILVRYCGSGLGDHFLYNFAGVARRSSPLLCITLIFLLHRTTDRYIRFTSVLEKRWFWWWFFFFLGLFSKYHCLEVLIQIAQNWKSNRKLLINFLIEWCLNHAISLILKKVRGVQNLTRNELASGQYFWNGTPV